MRVKPDASGVFGTSRGGAPKETDIKRSVSAISPERLEKLRRKALELEKHYLKTDFTPEKLVQQQAISYMSRELQKEKYKINLTYPVNPPFSFVHIIFDRKSGEFIYNVKEPVLKESDETLLETIKNRIEATMNREELPYVETKTTPSPQPIEKYLWETYEQILELYDIILDDKTKTIFRYFITRDLLGYGRCDAVMRDPYIEDVSCNGPDTPLYIYHRVFGSMRTNVVYPSESELNRHIVRLAQIAGKSISIFQPILDTTLADGSRINLTMGSEVTRKGSTFTIRKFSHEPISPIDLLRYKSIGIEQLAFLWTLIEHKRSILVSGGTASGKTTLLNALCMFMRPEDKVVSIEDTPEIFIDHKNWVQSITRTGYGISAGVRAGGGSQTESHGSITLYDLLVAALRQRPEYIIVGEVRGKEAFTLFQAISIGHASLSTIHAGTITELVHRVENEPLNIPRSLFQSLDAVLFQGMIQLGTKNVRRLRSIVEILEVDENTKNLITNEAFAWDPKSDVFRYSGRSYIIEEIARETGKTVDQLSMELARKQKYLALMDKKKISHFKDVSRAIGMYYIDPESAIMDMVGRK